MGNSFTTTPASGDGFVTGYYASRTDIEDQFGAENVRRWSQMDNDSTLGDTARIQRALDEADSLVNDFFRASRYTVPLVVAGGSAPKYWAARIAGIKLARARGQNDGAARYDEMWTAVMDEMGRYRSGDLTMDAAQWRSYQPTTPVVVIPPCG